MIKGNVMFNIIKESIEMQRKHSEGLVTYEEFLNYFRKKEVLFFYFCVFSLFLIVSSLFFSLPLPMTLVAIVVIGIVFIILSNIKTMRGQILATELIPVILFLLGVVVLLLVAYSDK
jgi:4-hydroxybenzoate polyprenyltransferase